MAFLLQFPPLQSGLNHFGQILNNSYPALTHETTYLYDCCIRKIAQKTNIVLLNIHSCVSSPMQKDFNFKTNLFIFCITYPFAFLDRTDGRKRSGRLFVCFTLMVLKYKSVYRRECCLTIYFKQKFIIVLIFLCYYV